MAAIFVAAVGHRTRSTCQWNLDGMCRQLIGYLLEAEADEMGGSTCGMEALAGGAAEAGAEPTEAGMCSVELQRRRVRGQSEREVRCAGT